MPAHLRSITRHCDRSGCARLATKELRSTYNAVVGYYCARHAVRALEDFKKGGG